jgi:CRP-like cAMP-binding protein
MAQMPMTALRVRVEEFQAYLSGEHALLRRLERYAAVRLSVLFQVAACNRLHRAEQRLCRWLLMMRDHVQQNELPITHDFLALMVGTRRSAVTEVTQRLEQQGLIGHERGAIIYKDVAGLERCACECFGIIRRLYQLLEQEM